MADDDIVRRAADHLERVVDRVLDVERQPPEATRLTIEDFPEAKELTGAALDDFGVDCDICEEYLAVAPGLDGWKTQEQSGPAQRPSHEHVGYYVLCTPCKESWERADYNELYERCSDAGKVDDLAHLAADTIRIQDPYGRLDGYGYEW